MSTIVLVHGAFADHHAFDAVVPLFEGRGHPVLAPDLPGHGGDSTPLGAINLEAYVERIRGLIKGPVVLVGHSMAGMVVSQVAERDPDRISALVYVAAYLPKSGQSLQQLAETDGESLVGKSLQFAPDYSTTSLPKAVVPEAIAADLPAQLQAIISESQRPEPLAPFQGVVNLGANFDRVKKAYLRTELDRAVTPILQSKMLLEYPQMPTRSLRTGHLPFLAQPEAFVEAVLALAKSAR